MAIEYDIANFITAKNISSYLESIHEDNISNEIYEVMKDRNYDIYGLHDDNNNKIGYITLKDYENKLYKVHRIDLNSVVSSDTAIGTIFKKLENIDFVFVLNKDKVTDIITIADLTNHYARAYVYVLISNFERELTSKIRKHINLTNLDSFLQKTTIEEALVVHSYRKSNNIDTDIFDCLKLSDKSKIYGNIANLKELGFQSKTKFDNFISSLIHKLRNPLSHSSNYITLGNKNDVIKLIIRLELILNQL